MTDTRLLLTLETAIEKWMEESCEEDWWDDSVGFISNDCAQRLARICALTLEESKLGQKIASE